jgi:hypothetical protein
MWGGGGGGSHIFGGLIRFIIKPNVGILTFPGILIFGHHRSLDAKGHSRFPEPNATLNSRDISSLALAFDIRD